MFLEHLLFLFESDVLINKLCLNFDTLNVLCKLSLVNSFMPNRRLCSPSLSNKSHVVCEANPRRRLLNRPPISDIHQHLATTNFTLATT
jgi:hypothetical protein